MKLFSHILDAARRLVRNPLTLTLSQGERGLDNSPSLPLFAKEGDGGYSAVLRHFLLTQRHKGHKETFPHPFPLPVGEGRGEGLRNHLLQRPAQSDQAIEIVHRQKEIEIGKRRLHPLTEGLIILARQ